MPGRSRRGHEGRLRRLLLLAAALVGAAGAALWTGLGEPRLPLSRWGSGRPWVLQQAVLRFAWPEYPGELRVQDPERLAALAAALPVPDRGQPTPAGEPPPRRQYYWYLAWQDARGSGLALWATRDFSWFQWMDGAAPGEAAAGPGPLPALAAVLAPLGAALRQQLFGEPLGFAEVSPLFPVGETAVVRDLETGITLRVYRHRGDSHADVEPLTNSDTQRLRQIYGGQWSWKRRAVVAVIGGRRVAGSINGMPHGWGDLFDNQFVGHFCLHFQGSRIHTTWRVDPDHQLMVWKAAGRLEELLEGASPAQLAAWVLAAVNQGERVTLRYATDVPWGGDLTAPFAPVRHLVVLGLREQEVDAQTARVLADLVVYYHLPDPDAGFRHRLELNLRRRPGGPGWLVAWSNLLTLAHPPTPAERSQARPAGGLPPPGGGGFPGAVGAALDC